MEFKFLSVISKIFTSPFSFFSPVKSTAFCKAAAEPSQSDKKAADQLSTLLEQGGMPNDPQTLMKILESRQSKMYPPSFQMLLLPIKLVTVLQGVDGMKVDVNMGLSQSFQLGGSWQYPNADKPSSFSLNSAVILNQPSPFEEPQMVQAISDSSGRLQFHSDLKIMNGLKCKLEGHYPNQDLKNAQIGVELVKNFNGSSYAFKKSPGMKSFTAMHNIFTGLSAGFEATFIDQIKDWKFAYGLRYQSNSSTFAFHYHPLRRKEIINFGYLFKASQKLNMVGEMKLCPQTGESDAILGFHLKFNQGFLKGSFSTAMKAASQFTHNFDPIIGITFNAEYDFMRSDNNSCFGVNLSIGG